MPYLSNVCDLFDYVQKNNVSEHVCKIIVNQLVHILIDCRKLQICHCDVKIENILINKITKEIHLIDFGCAKILSDVPCTDFIATVENIPPEYILKKEYTMQCAEVWSIGLVMYDIMFRHYPFNDSAEIALKELSFPLNSFISTDCKQLIDWCLTKDPILRPCLNCILMHSWLKW